MKESDARRFGCPARSLGAVEFLVMPAFLLLARKCAKGWQGRYVEESGYVSHDQWKDRRTTIFVVYILQFIPSRIFSWVQVLSKSVGAYIFDTSGTVPLVATGAIE